MSLIDNLNWRHAVKAYDPSKKVSEEHIAQIVEAARLAPTSSGLQARVRNLLHLTPSSAWSVPPSCGGAVCLVPVRAGAGPLRVPVRLRVTRPSQRAGGGLVIIGGVCRCTSN